MYATYSLMAKLGLTEIGNLRTNEIIYKDGGAEVGEGVFIGSLATATSEMIARCGIGHIVNMSGQNYVPPPGVTTAMFLMDDADISGRSEEYIILFSQAAQSILKARLEGKRVLVHCMAGVNRSATAVMWYFLNRGYDFDRAYILLSRANAARGVPLLTNSSFVGLLRTKYMLHKHDSQPSMHLGRLIKGANY